MAGIIAEPLLGGASADDAKGDLLFATGVGAVIYSTRGGGGFTSNFEIVVGKGLRMLVLGKDTG